MHTLPLWGYHRKSYLVAAGLAGGWGGWVGVS